MTTKQGGENEKLIFKILKRGEKLNLETAKEENDLVDSGLRYDLTLPLSRYYANHANELPNPFKALQMGNVWRADRPQKGRFRQFMQCDIDILGEPSNLAEIELILATTTTLGKLGFSRLQGAYQRKKDLKGYGCLFSGFPEEQYDLVFIILDKMDKIGLDGVKAELLESGFAQEMVDKYGRLFEGMQDSGRCDRLSCRRSFGDYLEEGVADSLSEIRTSVGATVDGNFEIVFDPTLVRGMSYYTGTIFEIAMPDFGGSCCRRRTL